MKKIIFIALMVITSTNVFTQNPATIQESMISMKTYPFFDPNPIPNPDNNYYPYFRFDGFSTEGEEKMWKQIILENDYIKVFIVPEIGGKIWGAIEKSTNNEFIYYNSVVKFRDIAMRGPWTSGGLELNFGLIGHSPTTSSTVDYKMKKNNDGSVSCFLSATDLITRTRWETEVNLKSDKAYFTTKTTWHNPTPLTQPYYHWINGGFQADGDLEFCFPGSHWIGHDGLASNWPFNKDGRNLAFYKQNNFGGDKSYHVVDGINDFYAAYWHDLNFGSVHFSPYNEKLGRKIFLWSQAKSGGIWKDLLTDNDGQYVELQSGRLFNQEASSSTATPFKHFGFEPYAVDFFTEYWFPIKNTKGVKKANQTGALNVEEDSDIIKLFFCPAEKIKDDINIFLDDQLVQKFSVDLEALEDWQGSFKINPDKNLKIIIGDNKLIYNEQDGKKEFVRPMQSPDDFDWQSTYGLFLDGLNWTYQNNQSKALMSFQKCLSKDPYYAPVLNQMAVLYYRKGDFNRAIQLSAKSLSINTYDPEANFIFGLSNKETGDLLNAQDGFAVASLTPSYRNASFVELCKLFLLKNDLTNARYYANKILDSNTKDIEANKLMAAICRKENKLTEAANYLRILEDVMKLNHHVEIERGLLNNTNSVSNLSIKSELPYESYLELAHWYQDIGDINTATEILKLSPDHALVQLNLAYISYLSEKIKDSKEYLRKAADMPTNFVFPFRLEEKRILEWAVKNLDNWKLKYYLGLLYWSFGEQNHARELFTDIGMQPDDPSFYISKSLLFTGEKGYSPEKDLIKAHNLGNKNWRTYNKLIDYYLRSNQTKQALNFAKEAIRKFPSNNTLKYVYSKCLMAEGLYFDAKEALMRTTILPSEGARDGRTTYRQACIMESLRFYEKGNYNAAIELIDQSRLWPENLGAGKPYESDERIEDFLEGKYREKLGQLSTTQKMYQKIIEFSEKRIPTYNSTDYLYVLALKNLKRLDKIDSFFNNWEKNKPEDPILRWVKAVFNDNINETSEIESLINTQTGGTPWDPKYADPEFEIIKKLSDTF
jgi:tetratricopeptide (TPR) repeat protein